MLRNNIYETSQQDCPHNENVREQKSAIFAREHFQSIFEIYMYIPPHFSNISH